MLKCWPSERGLLCCLELHSLPQEKSLFIANAWKLSLCLFHSVFTLEHKRTVLANNVGMWLGKSFPFSVFHLPFSVFHAAILPFWFETEFEPHSPICQLVRWCNQVGRNHRETAQITTEQSQWKFTPADRNKLQINLNMLCGSGRAINNGWCLLRVIIFSHFERMAQNFSQYSSLLNYSAMLNISLKAKYQFN